MDSLKSVCISDHPNKNGNSSSSVESSEETKISELQLHDAAQKYDCSKIKELLELKFDPNLKDDQGRTVLHVLLSDEFLGHLNEEKMKECLNVLGEFKGVEEIKVNEIDKSGETPLSLAVINGFESCALWLVEHGADSSVRTSKFKGMHSLPSCIAQNMPDVMMKILDSGVTLHKPNDEPEVKIKLDWRLKLASQSSQLVGYGKKFWTQGGGTRRRVLQFSKNEHEEEVNKSKHRKHKYKQRETSFLYSMLDVPPTERNKFLTHPLVSAFIELKSKAISKKLEWFQMLLSIYPLFYMVFIYFLYFNRCKIENSNDDEETEICNHSNNSSSVSQNRSGTSESKDLDQRCEISVPISVAAYILMTVVVGFGLVEVYMQLRVDTRYLKNWRTWVLRVSLLIMGLTLWPALQFNTLYNITWQYPIAALGTFFAWVMFLIQMELIPQVKVYLEMLVAITISVLKITLLFFPLLIGFYMGFNLMYFEIGGVMNFILMTVDVGSDKYENMIDSAKDKKTWFMIIAYIFGVAFIIIIAIVFMNFILGVSINDIQELKQNAKIMALSNKIQKLFIIDLVFPTRYNVTTEDNRDFSYGPKDKVEQGISENTRRKITLFLKSKYSTKPFF